MIGYVELDAEDVLFACNSFLDYYHTSGAFYRHENENDMIVANKLSKLAKASIKCGNGSVILDQEAVDLLF